MAGEGVGIRTRSLVRRPVEISTGAALMPVPPKSTPRTRSIPDTESVDGAGAGSVSADVSEDPQRGTYGQEGDCLEVGAPSLEAVQIFNLGESSLEKRSGAPNCWGAGVRSQECDVTVKGHLAEADNASVMTLF